MIKYAQIVNSETGLCNVGVGSNIEFYKSIGMIELNVEKSDVDNNWYLADKCPKKSEEQKLQEEKEKVLCLSLTRADVERALYKAKGIDFEDLVKLIEESQKDYEDLEIDCHAPMVLAMTENSQPIDIKALKIELKANNFYRANPLINQIGALLGYKSEDLDYLFINKELPNA